VGEGFFNKNWPLVGLTEEVGCTITYLNIGQSMGLGSFPSHPMFSLHVIISPISYSKYIAFQHPIENFNFKSSIYIYINIIFTLEIENP